METTAFIIHLCSALGIVAFASDIECIVRMKRRDQSSRPPPVLVTFAQLRIRSALLRNKVRLFDIEKYAKVFINLDEPIEVRRFKAVFRRVGYRARMDGKSVKIRDDWIMIEDNLYRPPDMDKIPAQYREGIDQPPKSANSTIPDVGAVGGAAAMDTGPDPSKSKASPSVMSELRPRREKIRLTKAGLTFSGPSAYLSHMHKCSFVFKKESYNSVEQGYHHLHAIFENEPEIATAIKGTENVYALKDLVVNLPDSEGWLKSSPGYMWDLNDAAFVYLVKSAL